MNDVIPLSEKNHLAEKSVRRLLSICLACIFLETTVVIHVTPGRSRDGTVDTTEPSCLLGIVNVSVLIVACLLLLLFHQACLASPPAPHDQELFMLT